MIRSGLIHLFVFFCLFYAVSNAQVYQGGGHTRHRFAQLNVGLDYSFFPAGSASTFHSDVPGSYTPQKMEGMSQARVLIGGIHFWGKADFFVSIPILQFMNKSIKQEVETGGKFFITRLKHHRVSPFVGAGFLYGGFRSGQGGHFERAQFPLSAGFGFLHGACMLDFGLSYFWNHSFNYYFEKELGREIKTPALRFSIGIKWMMETTLSAEKDWQSGRTQLLTDTLAKLKRLNGITLAIGPSSAFFTRSSPFIAQERPFLYQHKTVGIFPEFGLGYYFHSPDLQLNLVYRKNKSVKEAFGLQQQLTRRSLGFEVYKFLGDYHGFVPFAGLVVGRENIGFTEADSTMIHYALEEKLIRAGIVFGWDIRPNRIQSILLRTNLRWTPGLGISVANKGTMFLDQLEFNFIQVVIFPGRIF
jgi:hypothetical protein